MLLYYWTWRRHGDPSGIDLTIRLPALLPLHPNTESRIDALMEHIEKAWGSEAVDGAR